MSNPKNNNEQQQQTSMVEEGRKWFADKLEGLEQIIEPPKPEPEPKSFGDRVGDAVGKAKESLGLKQEEEPEPQTLSEDLAKTKEEAKDAARQVADDTRSWLADKVDGAADCVKPESEKAKEREANATFLTKAKEKTAEIKGNLQGKVEKGRSDDNKGQHE